MKLLAICLIFTPALYASEALSAKVPSGQLNFTLKTAGEPISIASFPEAGQYSALQAKLLGDGSAALTALRDFNGFANVDSASRERLDKIVDPEHKYADDWNAMVSAKENTWALPIVHYVEGDDSDDEQIYVTANRVLRNPSEPMPPAVAKWIMGMREAMTHIPKYEGLSFRGTRLTADRIAKFFPNGKPANDLAFISTSLEPSTAFKFATPGVNGPNDKEDKDKIALLFAIKGNSGRPISAFAHMHAHEQEILFANGTPMTVIAKSPVFSDKNLGKTQIIYLEEK